MKWKSKIQHSQILNVFSLGTYLSSSNLILNPMVLSLILNAIENKYKIKIQMKVKKEEKEETKIRNFQILIQQINS